MLGGLDGHGRHSRDGLLGQVERVDEAATGYDVGFGFREVVYVSRRRLGL